MLGIYGLSVVAAAGGLTLNVPILRVKDVYPFIAVKIVSSVNVILNIKVLSSQ